MEIEWHSFFFFNYVLFLAKWHQSYVVPPDHAWNMSSQQAIPSLNVRIIIMRKKSWHTIDDPTNFTVKGAAYEEIRRQIEKNEDLRGDEIKFN